MPNASQGGVVKISKMASKKEPPFFNDDNMGPCRCKLTFHETMELFIETLTGTYFELRVSPFETVISVKIKIQRLEGTFPFYITKIGRELKKFTLYYFMAFEKPISKFVDNYGWVALNVKL